MFQLAYISTAVPGLASKEFSQLLLNARRRNLRDGLTGLLIYDGRRFLQALEGEEGYTRATFERIRLDTRHRAVVLLSSRNVGERCFGTWEMELSIARPAPATLALSDTINMLTRCLPNSKARELFRGLAGIGRAAAEADAQSWISRASQM